MVAKERREGIYCQNIYYRMYVIILRFLTTSVKLSIHITFYRDRLRNEINEHLWYSMYSSLKISLVVFHVPHIASISLLWAQSTPGSNQPEWVSGPQSRDWPFQGRNLPNPAVSLTPGRECLEALPGPLYTRKRTVRGPAQSIMGSEDVDMPLQSNRLTAWPKAHSHTVIFCISTTLEF